MNSWACSSCGNVNAGAACVRCGFAMPQGGPDEVGHVWTSVPAHPFAAAPMQAHAAGIFRQSADPAAQLNLPAVFPRLPAIRRESALEGSWVFALGGAVCIGLGLLGVVVGDWEVHRRGRIPGGPTGAILTIVGVLFVVVFMVWRKRGALRIAEVRRLNTTGARAYGRIVAALRGSSAVKVSGVVWVEWTFRVQVQQSDKPMAHVVGFTDLVSPWQEHLLQPGELVAVFTDGATGQLVAHIAPDGTQTAAVHPSL